MKNKRAKTLFAVALGITALWPWLGNPFGFLHLRDSVRTSVPIALMFGEPCATYKDDYIVFDRSPACYKFDEPRVYKGVWLYEFEGSRFIDGAKSVPARMPEAGSTAWLSYNPEQIDPTGEYNSDPDRECYPIYAFAISFIGRRNPQGGGHLGMFDSEIWPERILSAKALPSPDCRIFRL
jgi:hypothetical protein